MSEKKMIATRDGFGKEIVELGKENPNILVVDIDIGKSCKTGEFRKELPGQYINVGIAEQNGAGVAAGLATCGKIPFVVTYAVFGSLRMCEMIRQEICYPNLNVKIACSHGGVTPANDGASHQAIEDMGVLRTIPNMTVIMPADYNSARKLVRQAAEVYGPVYLRFTRDAIPQIYDEDVEFTIGKAHQIRDGKDVALIANGDTVRLAVEAAKALADKGEAAVPDERLRLMWLGRGMWQDFAFYQRFEEKYGAVFMWSMYLAMGADAYIRNHVEEDPLRALAARFIGMEDFLHMPPWNSSWFIQQAAQNDIDGVVYMIPDNDIQAVEGSYFIKKNLEAEGIPVLTFNADPVNPKKWNAETMTALVDEFIEQRVIPTKEKKENKG